MLLARTGYTGEDGFEVYAEAPHAADVWATLSEAGGLPSLPAGLACRDTLRLEAGMPLYGNELTADMTPFDAGLGRVVKFDKAADFVGRAALERRRDAGRRGRAGTGRPGRRRPPSRPPRLPGPGRRRPGRHGDERRPVPDAGPPDRDGLRPPTLTEPGTKLTVDIRGKAMPV